jgi:hypothetical protein
MVPHQPLSLGLTSLNAVNKSIGPSRPLVKGPYASWICSHWVGCTGETCLAVIIQHLGYDSWALYLIRGTISLVQVLYSRRGVAATDRAKPSIFGYVLTFNTYAIKALILKHSNWNANNLEQTPCFSPTRPSKSSHPSANITTVHSDPPSLEPNPNLKAVQPQSHPCPSRQPSYSGILCRSGSC